MDKSHTLLPELVNNDEYIKAIRSAFTDISMNYNSVDVIVSRL